jgi:hypothetical protein
MSFMVAAMSELGSNWGEFVASGVGAQEGVGGFDSEFGDWGESGILGEPTRLI